MPITPEGQRYRDALRGDCHTHSTWSDGGATIEEMATTAIALGHEYIVLTDHSARLTVAHGLDRERLIEQIGVVAVLNEELAPFRILHGMEVDINLDGSLDLDDDLLAHLDVVVASVHSKLRMDRKEMTPRMIAAVRSPHVDILGHCTGRLIGKRPPSVVRRRRRVRGVRRVGHGGRDQLATGTPRPAVRAARAGDRRRLLVLHRQRRPRHRAARVAAARLRPGGQVSTSRSSGSSTPAAPTTSLAWTGYA